MIKSKKNAMFRRKYRCYDCGGFLDIIASVIPSLPSIVKLVK